MLYLLLEQNCTVCSGDLKSQVGSGAAVTGEAVAGLRFTSRRLILIFHRPIIRRPTSCCYNLCFFSLVQRGHQLSFDFPGINGAL